MIPTFMVIKETRPVKFLLMWDRDEHGKLRLADRAKIRHLEFSKSQSEPLARRTVERMILP